MTIPPLLFWAVFAALVVTMIGGAGFAILWLRAERDLRRFYYCQVSGCMDIRPHYHRDTLDGEEIVFT